MRKLFAIALVLLTTSVVLTDSLSDPVPGAIDHWEDYLDPLEPVHYSPGRVLISKATLATVGLMLGYKTSLNEDMSATVPLPSKNWVAPDSVIFSKEALGCAVSLVNFLKIKTGDGVEFQPVVIDAEELFLSAGTSLEVLKQDPIPRPWRESILRARDADVLWFLANLKAQKQITYKVLDTSYVISPGNGDACYKAYDAMWPQPEQQKLNLYTEVRMVTTRQ